MNDFGKIVKFNGIFYHPYFCVNKQNIKNTNPRQCASVKSRSQYSNAPRLQSKIFPVTDISCLEHAHFLGNCDFEQQFIPSLFTHIYANVHDMELNSCVSNITRSEPSNALGLKTHFCLTTNISWFERAELLGFCVFSDFGDISWKFPKSWIFNRIF